MHQPVIDKGLRRAAISFASSVIIGVSSAAPAYSLASALGVIAATASFATPSILLIAFVPMLCVALAYAHLNRAEPDCGTTFTWVTRAMGPHAGWLGGWAVIVTNLLVMPSLAVIAGQYSLHMLGIGQPSTLAVTTVGVGWIIAMTALCTFGIELSARAQRWLLGGEVAILTLFAVVAFVLVLRSRAIPTSALGPGFVLSQVSPAWLDPSTIGSYDQFTQSLLAAVFIYWGWDSALSVNEETENAAVAPGHAAMLSTLLLVMLYLAVAVAALAVAGPDLLAANSADVFVPLGTAVLGPQFGLLLGLAVLTSAAASTQTSLFPAARTALSMAHAGALPQAFGRVDPGSANPAFGTIVMGAVSVGWYVALTLLSKNVLDDSILALGLCISFYYGLTALACVVLYRDRILSNTADFFLLGALPAIGGVAMLALFAQSCVSLYHAGATSIFGVGGPLIIGLGALALGGACMAVASQVHPTFFRSTDAVERVVTDAEPHG